MSPAAERDSVSAISAQWQAEGTELNIAPMEIFGRIAKLHRIQLEASDRSYAHLDITGPDFDMLATLRRSGRPYRLTPSELTATMMISSGGVTQRVDRLEQRGLVERTPSPHDRRSTVVGLTPAGRRLIDKALRGHLDTEEELLSPLGARDRAALTTLLRRLLAGLEAAPE